MDNETLTIRLVEAEKAVSELQEALGLVNMNMVQMAKVLNQIIAAINDSEPENLPDTDPDFPENGKATPYL